MCGPSVLQIVLSTRCEDVALYLVILQGQNDALQETLPVLAPRVAHESPPQSLDALRLVNMPMESEHRLVLRDRVRDRLAAPMPQDSRRLSHVLRQVWRADERST